MTPRLLLIPGTHSRSGPGIREWWHADQPLARAARAHGYEPPAFLWTSQLDGIVGPSRVWRDAGEKLGFYLQLHPVAAILAHSYGSELVPVAVLASHDVMIPALVTLGTPVRAEREVLWQRMMLSGRVGRWLHVSAEGDWWQWWGSHPPWTQAWRPSAWRTERTMRWATENRSAGRVGHRGLVDPAVLERVGLWPWLAAGP